MNATSREVVGSVVFVGLLFVALWLALLCGQRISSRSEAREARERTSAEAGFCIFPSRIVGAAGALRTCASGNLSAHTTGPLKPPRSPRLAEQFPAKFNLLSILYLPCLPASNPPVS